MTMSLQQLKDAVNKLAEEEGTRRSATLLVLAKQPNGEGPSSLEKHVESIELTCNTDGRYERIVITENE